MVVLGATNVGIALWLNIWNRDFFNALEKRDPSSAGRAALDPGRHRRVGWRGRRHPAARQAPPADQLARLAVPHHRPALAAFGAAVPARPAGRRIRQSRRPHRRGHSRLDGARRRIRAEDPAMRPAAHHLPERAVDPVGIAADQARRFRVRPAGLHGVGRRGLRPVRLVAHLCARARPDPCRQCPSGPRGRCPLGPDPGTRARRGHRPDARRGR